MTLDKPIIGAAKDANGVYQPAYIRTIQMPYWQLELAMRGNQFFGRFIKYIADAIEVGFGDQYIAGLTMNILAEFVPAGTDAQNPFTRKENKYGIKEYDRYIYHVVGVEHPTLYSFVFYILYTVHIVTGKHSSYRDWETQFIS